MTNGYIFWVLCTTDTRGKSQITSSSAAVELKEVSPCLDFILGKIHTSGKLRFCLTLLTFYVFLLKVPLVM